jgi:hypothetical protein
MGKDALLTPSRHPFPLSARATHWLCGDPRCHRFPCRTAWEAARVSEMTFGVQDKDTICRVAPSTPQAHTLPSPSLDPETHKRSSWLSHMCSYAKMKSGRVILIVQPSHAGYPVIVLGAVACSCSRVSWGGGPAGCAVYIKMSGCAICVGGHVSRRCHSKFIGQQIRESMLQGTDTQQSASTMIKAGRCGP